VDRAQVGVLEEADEVGLRSLLEREHGRALEAEVGLEVLRDLANQALERELADQELGRLLVPADLAEGDRARAVSVGLFTPPVAGADLRAALVASCLRGALPPVDLRAVCLVRAILKIRFLFSEGEKRGEFWEIGCLRLGRCGSGFVGMIVREGGVGGVCRMVVKWGGAGSRWEAALGGEGTRDRSPVSLERALRVPVVLGRRGK